MRRLLFFVLAAMIGTAGIWTTGLSSAQAEDMEDFFSDISIHGFVSQGYMYSDKNNYIKNSKDGTFEFNEIGLNFHKVLTDDMRVGIQLLSRDFGASGNNRVEIDWAYADWSWRNWLGLQVGVIRPSIGLYNEVRDLDLLRTGVLLPITVYDKNLWDRYSNLRGAGIYGSLDAGSAGSFSYRFLMGYYDLESDGDTALLLEDMGLGEFRGIDSGVIYNGYIEYQPPVYGLDFLDELRFRLSMQKATDVQYEGELSLEVAPGMSMASAVDVNMDNLETKVFSMEMLMWENLRFMVEYSMANAQIDTRVALLPDAMQPAYFDQDSVSWYAGASYRFSELLEIGIVYSEYIPDMDDKRGRRYDKDTTDPVENHHAWLKDLAVSLRFDINENWTIKTEGHLFDGSTSLLDSENPDGFARHWWMGAAKMTFSF